MDAFLDVAYNVVAPIFLVVGISALFSLRFKLDTQTLSSLIVYLFSPLLVLDGIANSDLRADEIGRIGAVVILLALVMALMGWGLARLFRFDRKLESAFVLTVVLINAGNYGLPLNEFAFGEPGLQRAMVFYVASALVTYTLGVYLASRGSASIRRSLLNVLKVPLVYAMALGLFLNFTGQQLPVPLARAVSLLGQAAVPAMLVLLGIQLTRTSLKGHMGPIALAAGTRLLVAPVLAFVLVALLGLSGVSRQVSIVQASMPTAVLSGVLATEFGSDAEFTTAVILVSTLASLVTLSALLALVG